MKKLQIKTLADRVGGIFEITPVDGGGGGSGGCTYNPVTDCQTTCLFRVECCCYYRCPSGNTWVCKRGYCSNTSHSCP